jgi:hypothetical protein
MISLIQLGFISQCISDISKQSRPENIRGKLIYTQAKFYSNKLYTQASENIKVIEPSTVEPTEEEEIDSSSPEYVEEDIEGLNKLPKKVLKKVRSDPLLGKPKMARSRSDSQLAPRPRKEMQEVQKMYKTTLKQAEKRTLQFLKQLEKSEVGKR